MIRLLSIISLLSAFCLTGFAQRKADWGITAGTTTYYGDMTAGGLVNSPGVGGGVFYRYNFHPRHSIKNSFKIASLQGSDKNAGNDFHTARDRSFSGLIVEVASQFEFNFFPYSTDGRRWEWSPYLSGGPGIAFLNTDVTTYVPVLPFAVGFKVNIYKNIGFEIEYGFRKTFYDNFDGLIDPVDPEHQAWTHNNDWYTFAGVSLTWKMYNRFYECPAYEERKNYKRR